jgi:N-acetylmuramoyl-L-alanine amidase
MQSNPSTPPPAADPSIPGPIQVSPDTSAPIASPPVTNRRSRDRQSTNTLLRTQGAFFQLGMVVLVAALVATLFTAWTPGSYLQEMPTQQSAAIAAALQPSPTLPPGAPTPTLRNPKLIGIVAGHWKNDAGAVCPDGRKEVDVNLRIATLVQKILTDQGYQVEILHEFDPRLEDYQAAALVSIHNDSCDFINTEATGYKVASAMATRHPELAARLTACLRSRYGATTGLTLHSTSVTPDMTSYHAFGEINENTPAAIIETGFLNLDGPILFEKPELVAQGVAAGILCFMRNESIGPPAQSPAPSSVATTVPAQPTTPTP